MRRTLFPILGALVALVLAGCTITIEPIIPPNAVDVTATTDPNTPVYADTLSAGDSEVFEITIPQAVRDNYDVVYLELSENIELEQRSGTYVLIASSNSADFFARYADGLQSVDAGIEEQGIDLSVTCRGSCIIFEPTSGTYYAHVKNDSGGPIYYDLYVYGDVLQDDTEPENGARATAPTYVVGTTASGAIETLGDRDFWWVPGAGGSVAFDAPNANVALEATVLNASGTAVAGPYTSGDQFDVFPGEYIRIESANGRAGSSAKSDYYLSSPGL